ncbi:MAG: tRNA threonylcarbamoyladenosine dehydratase [Burkholderiaceae bacterium]
MNDPALVSPAHSADPPPLPYPADPLEDRRFAALGRLYGAAGLARLRAAHVVVVGIGGVGSWCAEALARSAVGRLTLIDMDHVAESNVNRQIHALASTLGAAKIEAMAVRIADIAADCRVDVVDDFVDPDNVATIVPAADVIVDAIDQPRAKAALIAWARRAGRPIIVCGAAGGRTDPLRLRCDDLARTRGDALLSSVRARLRREHGFPRDPGQRFRVDAIFSDEQVRALPGAAGGAARTGGAPLNCAGYGSAVGVTAPMGMAAAQRAINRLADAR